jgi:hypothetical protein
MSFTPGPRLAVLLATLLAGGAYAGAWSQPEGTVYLRLASKLYLAPQVFDARGRRLSGDFWDPDARLDALSWNLIAEYGVFGPLTVTAETTVKRLHSSRQVNYGRDIWVTGLADSALGLRWGFWQRALVAAIDARVEFPAGYRRYDDQVSLGSGWSALVARALLGGSAPLPLGNYFDLHAGYRHRFGPYAGDLVGALAVGVEPIKRLWVRAGLAGQYNLRPTESFIGTAESTYLAVAAAITWISPIGVGLELGASADAAGRNAFGGWGFEVVLDLRRSLTGGGS